MKISAIISEYNPFHNGHQYQIDCMRLQGITHVVAVMSPNFVQRGDAAILDKRVRAKAALACGVDLVLEIPTPFALASARQFAFGAISTIEALGCVHEISFGSECGNISQLSKIVEFVYSDSLYPAMEGYLQKGLNFPTSRTKAVADVLGKEYADIISQPNNILGIEYIGQLLELASTITPTTVKRTVAHDSGCGTNQFASASHIRSLLLGGEWKNVKEYVPAAAWDCYEEALLSKRAPNSLADLEVPLIYKLRTMSVQDILALPDISEGLENRIYRAVRSEASVAAMIDEVKTKRYAHSRIRRIFASALLGVNAELCKTPPPYIRVLGLNERGREILAKARKSAILPVNDSLAKLEALGGNAQKFASLEALAHDVYNLCISPQIPCGLDYTLGCVRTNNTKPKKTE